MTVSSGSLRDKTRVHNIYRSSDQYGYDYPAGKFSFLFFYHCIHQENFIVV